MQKISRRTLLEALGLGLAAAGISTLDPIHAVSAAAGAPVETRAKPARDFVSSIGVNIHGNYYDTAYGNSGAWMKAVLDGGFGYVRAGFTQDPTLLSLYAQLMRAGIKVSGVCDMHLVAAETVASWLAANPQAVGSYWALEGPNEPDVNPMPDGRNWASATRAYMEALSRHIRGNAATRALKIIGPSVAQLDNPQVWKQLGDLAPYIDYGCSHAYPGNGGVTDALEALISAQNAFVAPGKPIAVTETGISTQHPAQRDAPEGNLPMDAAHAAILLPRLYLENFRAGISLTAVYELVDERSDGTWEHSLGLLNNDYSAKPAYRAVRALTTLLRDNGGAAGFAPGSLAYALHGRTAATRDLLLQKADGTFWLAVWEQQQVWDYVRQRSLATLRTPLVLALARPATASVMRLDAGGASTFTGVKNLELDSSAQVTLVKIAA